MLLPSFLDLPGVLALRRSLFACKKVHKWRISSVTRFYLDVLPRTESARQTVWNPKRHPRACIARANKPVPLDTNSNGRYKSGEKVRMMEVKAFMVNEIYFIERLICNRKMRNPK